MNYTGVYFDTVSSLVYAFTGQQIPSPDTPQDPGYADAQLGAVTVTPDGGGWQEWGEPIPSADTRAAEPDGSLSIDFAMIRRSSDGLSLIEDGDTLRDGVNRPEEGDQFGIAFGVSEQVYVYITSVDATGWGQTLFPYPEVVGFDNPVRPGTQVFLPGKSMYGLDDARGVETIFLLVSRAPREDLEQVLEPLRGKERNTFIGARGNSARVTIPLVGQRGIGAVTASETRSGNLQLDRYIGKPGENEIAFSRWFNHE
jgi:hypothetical protein